MRRRDFLASIAATGLASLTGCDGATPALPPGELLGASLDLGHRLRHPDFPAPGETRRVPVVIVGGGIGGLSTGWKLDKAGFKDFLLLELESEPGGNSRSGRNAAGAYPLGAHYLPLPTREARATRELLAELGVLQGDPGAARPRYDERYLCATPQERLFRNGLWQEGLLPQADISAAERDQYRRFYELIGTYRERRDRHGRRAFAVPMELSSRAPDLMALDRMTMRDWLLAQKIDSPHLHWYVDYACRDDFGAGRDAVSAWAGIHYFACRDGEAEDAASDVVLTAPEGNAWLARGLAARVEGRVQSAALVYRFHDNGREVELDVWLAGEQRSVRVVARQAVWAAPLYLLPHVWQGHEALRLAARSYSHAPWLVANLMLDRLPEERAGAPLAWDNVIYGSPGLGYVVATHQQMRLRTGATVFTYYRAVADRSPSAGRELLLRTTREEWVEKILAELSVPHPDIRQRVTRSDVMRYGHAMARPVPGSLWHGQRQLFAADSPRFRFAHADVSGFSIFEEAQYRGVLAAERTLARLGIRYTSSLV